MITGNILHGSNLALWDYLLNANRAPAVDIGAGTGDHVSEFLTSGSRLVYAFEPIPQLFWLLVEKHGSNPLVRCRNIGLSSFTGTLRDVVISRPVPSNLDLDTFAGRPICDIQVTTLDALFARSGISAGLVRLNADGYEFQAMQGGSTWLKEYRPSILCRLGNNLEDEEDTKEAWFDLVFGLGYCVLPSDGAYVFSDWGQLEPWYPTHTTFDAILMNPRWCDSLPSQFIRQPAPQNIHTQAPTHMYEIRI